MRIKNSLLLKALVITIAVQCLLACDSDLFSRHQHSANESRETSVNQATPQMPSELWEMSQLGEKQHFTVKLRCNVKPYVGDFQVCSILLKQGDQNLKGAIISIDGGMKTHGHGLPTSPKLIETDIAGQYKIEGLKFSMPGKWVLGFKASANQLPGQSADQQKNLLEDQIIFNFSI